jgi:PAS domain S-box-containing protein
LIFVADATGQCIYVSRDWHTFTGQDVADALGQGWLDRVHPDDRSIVRSTRAAAIQAAAEYSLRYRLMTSEGTFRWVGSGGVPSFGPPDKRFIGYLGTITELAEGATDTILAYGNVERFAPPPPHPATLPSSDLDLVADHLILAHSLVEKDGGKEALPDLREALFKIGRALAARMRQGRRPLN